MMEVVRAFKPQPSWPPPSAQPATLAPRALRRLAAVLACCGKLNICARCSNLVRAFVMLNEDDDPSLRIHQSCQEVQNCCGLVWVRGGWRKPWMTETKIKTTKLVRRIEKRNFLTEAFPTNSCHRLDLLTREVANSVSQLRHWFTTSSLDAV